MNDLVLREGGDVDVTTIVSIIHLAFQEYDGRLDPPSGAHRETPEKILDRLATDRPVLALLGERAIGCVFYRAEQDHMYFGRLAVLPPYRGRGIGDALIAYVEARARDFGLPCVRLGVRVVLPNLRARYERLGYRLLEERRHKGYSQTTYLIMEKVLVNR